MPAGQIRLVFAPKDAEAVRAALLQCVNNRASRE